MRHIPTPAYSAPILLFGKIVTALGLAGIIFWPRPGAYTLLAGLGLILLWFCIIFSRLAVLLFFTGIAAGAAGGIFEDNKIIVISASVVGTGCAIGMTTSIVIGAYQSAKQTQKKQKMVKLKNDMKDKVMTIKT